MTLFGVGLRSYQAAQAAPNEQLQTIIDAQAPPGPRFDRVSVSDSDDVQFPSADLARGMVVNNEDLVGTLLVSHLPNPTAGAAGVRAVQPGRSTAFLPCSNANQVYLRSVSGTIVASYDGDDGS